MSSSLVIYVRQRPRVGKELESEAGKNTTLKLSDTELLFNPYDGSEPAVSKFATSRARQNYDQKFQFAKVFDEANSDDEVYSDVVSSRLDAVLQGQNVLVFAYGATGCGKSYTIGDFHQRISSDLFERIAAFPDSRSVTVKLRYFEIYSEKPYDLLPQTKGSATVTSVRNNAASTSLRFKASTTPMTVSGQKRPALRICCDRNGTRVQGICEYTVESAESMNEFINLGNKNRVVAATQANFQSSRSHAVLQIEISQTLVRETGHIPIKKTSTFTVIDLAGNERALHTHNSGIRLREGGEINKSLLALGRCLHARAGITPCRPPYRDSCLTRLLQNSLEGHCQTSMIVCISPCDHHFEETRNSLLYGQVASAAPRFHRGGPPSLRSMPQHPLEGRVRELETLVLTLQSKLDQVSSQLKAATAKLNATTSELQETKSELNDVSTQLEKERRLRVPLPEDATTSALITKLSNISPRRRFRVA